MVCPRDRDPYPLDPLHLASASGTLWRLLLQKALYANAAQLYARNREFRHGHSNVAPVPESRSAIPGERESEAIHDHLIPQR